MVVIRIAGIYIFLISIYGLTWLIALLSSIIPRFSWKPTSRIMVTGTFHNPNWYLSHITPLTLSGIKEIILIVDEPQRPLEGVRFVCWPRWASRLLSRPGARAIWMIVAGFRYRPDLYMGYHLGIGACTALIVGKLMGRPTCYQMTGGPPELVGSGFDTIAMNGKIFQHKPKAIVRLAIAVVRQFELVVVRGNKAKEFLNAHGVKQSITIITGSIRNDIQLPTNGRGIHIIFVGRLSAIKQVDQFIEIVNSVKCVMPNVRAAIVGDGPLFMDMQAYTEELGLCDNIKFFGKKSDVEIFLSRSRIFVLTSKSEGLSIAMAEAMAAGAVPVVANVGELSDLVIDGVNGYLVEPNNINEYTKKIVSLLHDQALWEKCSNRAIESAISHCDIEVVSKKWRQHIQDVVSQASGFCKQGVLS